MDHEERKSYHDELAKFIRRYVQCAQQAARLGKDQFRMRPKLHVPRLFGMRLWGLELSHYLTSPGTR